MFVAILLVTLMSGAPAWAAPSQGREPIDVIPLPAHVEFRNGSFALDAGTRISFPRDRAAVRVASYFADLLHMSSGLRLTPRPGVGGAHSIEFTMKATAGANPESYTVDISEDRVVVSAGNVRGLFYGAVTLWQLSSAAIDDRGAPAQRAIPAMRIVDSPRFSWRGLMLDSARQLSIARVHPALHRLDGTPQAQCSALASDRRSGVAAGDKTISAADERRRLASTRRGGPGFRH